MTPLCFIDTETTGVHPDRRAWEIAMVDRDETGDHELLLQITDVDLSNADPFGLQVGGFYDRAFAYLRDDSPVREQRNTWKREGASDVMLCTEAKAARVVWRWTRGRHLVGAVPDFDARTLDPMLRRQGLIPAWHYHLIDVETMAVGWLNRQNGAEELLTPPWKSDVLSRMCGVEPPGEDERHTALGDARWAMRWYDAMTGRIA